MCVSVSIAPSCSPGCGQDREDGEGPRNDSGLYSPDTGDGYRESEFVPTIADLEILEQRLRLDALEQTSTAIRKQVGGSPPPPLRHRSLECPAQAVSPRVMHTWFTPRPIPVPPRCMRIMGPQASGSHTHRPKCRGAVRNR